MKRFIDLVMENQQAIIDEVKECWDWVIKSEGRLRYVLYIWEDGRLETLCCTSESEHLESRTDEPLYELGVVEHDDFDWVDYCNEKINWDDDEATEALKEETLEWLTDDADDVANEFMENLIAHIEAHEHDKV